MGRKATVFVYNCHKMVHFFFQLEWETILFRKLISVIVTVPFKGHINQPLSKKELMKGVGQQRTIILNIYFNIYIYTL